MAYDLSRLALKVLDYAIEQEKRLTGHGQDEMMFHCDSCGENVSIDTYDVLTAEDNLHCPLRGASAGHLAVYMFDEKKLRED